MFNNPTTVYQVGTKPANLVDQLVLAAVIRRKPVNGLKCNVPLIITMILEIVIFFLNLNLKIKKI